MLSLAPGRLGAPLLADAPILEATRTLVGIVANLSIARFALALVAAAALLEVVAVRTAAPAA